MDAGKTAERHRPFPQDRRQPHHGPLRPEGRPRTVVFPARQARSEDHSATLTATTRHGPLIDALPEDPHEDALASLSASELVLVRDALDWARNTTDAQGNRIIDDLSAQRNMAEVYSHLEAMRVMNARMSWQLDQAEMDPVFPSAIKVYSTEIMIEICRLLMDVVGPHALITGTSEGTVLHGNLEHEYRRATINTFGGGVTEVGEENLIMAYSHIAHDCRLAKSIHSNFN